MERWFADTCAEGFEPRMGIVLAHGAGSDANSALLRAVSRELAGAGILVLRMNLAFRLARAGPPRPAESPRDRDSLREAMAELRRLAGASIPLLLGGHSYGGRQASMLAAEEPDVAAALVLLSYPLHPPDKPAQLRTAHFPQLRTPALFIHGDRDPFGTIDELAAAIAAIPARTQLVVAAKKGHDLGGAKPPAIAAHIADAGFLQAADR